MTLDYNLDARKFGGDGAEGSKAQKFFFFLSQSMKNPKSYNTFKNQSPRSIWKRDNEEFSHFFTYFEN